MLHRLLIVSCGVTQRFTTITSTSTTVQGILAPSTHLQRRLCRLASFSTSTSTSSSSSSSSSLYQASDVQLASASGTAMSEKHLQAGEPLPPLKDGSVRLFSMKYCPFAQRPRLVLHAKGIEYDEINCHLENKPEFLVERNADGKVPVYEHNGNVVIESSVICDLLDDLHPDPPLYPKDPFKKAKDKITMETFSSKVIPGFYQSIRTAGENEEAVAKLLAGLAIFEADLKDRATPFFGGDQPGMVDYCTWPFSERVMAFDAVYPEVRAKFPVLEAYFQRMVAVPAVKAVSNSKEKYQRFFKGYVTRNFEYEL